MATKDKLPLRQLFWVRRAQNLEDAQLPNPDGTIGVLFSLSHRPINYRRGPYRLLIEVMDGIWHHEWGCFDEQDQPERYYHSKANAQLEAGLIATVLASDFEKLQARKQQELSDAQRAEVLPIGDQSNGSE